MGKYAKYKKKYKAEWELLPPFKGWLQCDPNDNSKGFCKLCNVFLRAHKTDLLRHKNTVIHQRKSVIVKQAQSTSTLTQMGINIVNNDIKIMELKLAVHVAIHASIQTVDHLSDLMVLLGTNTKLENLKLHRTKCSMLIKNVISPSLMKDLISDIGQSCYSLIIDESTDISVCKYMAICIRYFSITKNKIVTTYLGMYEVDRATAEILSESLLTFLKNHRLDIKNLIGLGTDGASSLCGKNHSVYTLLKIHAPHLQLIKCVAHSLHICSSKAAEILPASVDFLCRETYNWFSCSPLRRSLYKETFNLLNNNSLEHKLHQIVQLSNTRWLARAQAIHILLEQWLELKTHFSVVVEKEKCYMARTLNEMFQDNTLYLYLVFIHPILINVNRVNLMFQSDTTDIFEVYSELYSLLLFTLRMIVQPIFLTDLTTFTSGNFQKILQILDNPLALLPSYSIDYGIRFRETVHEKSITELDVQPVKDRCKDFVLCLAKEMAIRIPTNISLYNSVRNFSPKICMNVLNRPKFEELPFELLDKSVNKTHLEIQWKNLLNVNFKIGSSYKSEEFWVEVYNLKDACDNYIFRELAIFALTTISLPLSNAVVERVFSAMNNIKTKVRNKMNMDMLDALLRIKIDLKTNNIQPWP